MSEVFKNAKLILTESMEVLYLSPPNTTSMILSIFAVNTSDNSINIEVYWCDYSDNNNETYLCKTSLQGGETKLIIGGDMKFVLESNDSIKAKSDSNSFVHLTLSALEMS